MRRTSLSVGFCFAALAVTAGLASASEAPTITMKASLNASQQVPPQKVKTPNASGHFKGTLLRYSNGRAKLTWTLGYQNLSSRATQAEVLVPANGKQGEVYVLLCRPCKPNSRGVVNPILVRSTKVLVTRVAYVVIWTKKNPKGEIRGRITKLG